MGAGIGYRSANIRLTSFGRFFRIIVISSLSVYDVAYLQGTLYTLDTAPSWTSIRASVLPCSAGLLV